jgi:hypothetical protein
MFGSRRPQVDVEQLRCVISDELTKVFAEHLQAAFGEVYRLGMIAGTARISRPHIARVRCED